MTPEEELTELSEKYGKRFASTGNDHLNAAIGQIRAWGFEDGFREAMRLNAMTKLESLWSSDEDVAYRLCPQMDCYTSESIRGAYAAYRWLKARVLGGQK